MRQIGKRLRPSFQTCSISYQAMVQSLTSFSVRVIYPCPSAHCMLMSKRKWYIANILPPPRSLEIKTVKLLTDPIYLSYQRHTATLSLMTSVYIKYAPPAWGPVPKSNAEDASEQTEWKRRIKMYCTCALPLS